MTPSTSVDAYWGGTMPWISSKEVKSWAVNGGSECITEKAMRETRLRECPVGSVLVVVRSGVLAHTLPVGITTRPVVVNQDVKALSSGNTDLNAWLGVYLRAHEREILGSNRKDGTTVQSIRVEELLDRVLPVPPLPEQHRIVEQVEALLAGVNKAKDRLDRVKVILKRFRQAVLAAACSGRLTEEWRRTTSCAPSRAAIDALLARQGEAKTRRGVPDAVERPESLAEFKPPDTWLCVSVAECLRSGVLIDVKDGNHGANHPKVADFTPSGLPFITAAQVGRFLIDYDGAYRISGKPLKALRVGFARPGDAILTHKGSVGRSALCSRECVLTPQTTYYRAEPSVIDSEFLVYWFAAPWFYAQLAAVMSQTTRDFVPISEQYNLFLVLPPLPEQREIVRLLRGLLTLADTIETRVTIAAFRAEKLPQTILSKAFRGELVPTEADLARAEGRSFESAEEMLKSISDSKGTERLRRPPHGKRIPRSRRARA